MVYRKLYFVKIASLEPISNDKVFLSLTKNIKDSHIQLIKAEEVILKWMDIVNYLNTIYW